MTPTDVIRILEERAVAAGRPSLPFDEWIKRHPRPLAAGPGLPEKGQGRQEYIKQTLGLYERGCA